MTFVVSRFLKLPHSRPVSTEPGQPHRFRHYRPRQQLGEVGPILTGSPTPSRPPRPMRRVA